MLLVELKSKLSFFVLDKEDRNSVVTNNITILYLFQISMFSSCSSLNCKPFQRNKKVPFLESGLQLAILLDFSMLQVVFHLKASSYFPSLGLNGVLDKVDKF